MFKTDPVIFAVNNTYHIMIPVTKPSILYVKIGKKYYYDESNGIKRSEVSIHRVIVPKDELDKAMEYTVSEQVIIDRKPYFPETEKPVEMRFEFQPVKGKNVCAYHVSDTHSYDEAAIRAAKTFGHFDFLILNGDIPNHSGTVENMETIYKIAAALTKGRIPTVFARGNHDLRGIYAESFEQYTPADNGKTYYTFRLGGIWGLILDCGEDKNDSNPEYGSMVCCHEFRIKETEFINKVIANAENEYLADGVTHRIVVVHNPFTCKYEPPFNIEEDIYSEWARLLKENIKPDLMICGHKHTLEINEPGCECDALGQPCTVVVGATIKCGDQNNETYFAGTGFKFSDSSIEVTFTDSEGKILGKKDIAICGN